MEKVLICIFMTVFILGISSCGRKESVPETPDPAAGAIQNADTGPLTVEKTWAQEDIASMFSHVQETDWDYIDCVLTPDSACGRVGAVLFWNGRNETSNVAFFDADGFYQPCGVYAGMPTEPDFKYLGDGAVTFKLKTDEDATYNYTLTISMDDGNVHFKAEDDLAKQT